MKLAPAADNRISQTRASCWSRLLVLVQPWLPLLLLLSLLLVPAEASCRVGSLRCSSDRDCWSGGRNSSVPSDCKCCTGFPFPQGGECRRFCDRNAFLYTIELQDRLKTGGGINGIKATPGGMCNSWGKK